MHHAIIFMKIMNRCQLDIGWTLIASTRLQDVVVQIRKCRHSGLHGHPFPTIFSEVSLFVSDLLKDPKKVK